MRAYSQNSGPEGTQNEQSMTHGLMLLPWPIDASTYKKSIPVADQLAQKVLKRPPTDPACKKVGAKYTQEIEESDMNVKLLAAAVAATAAFAIVACGEKDDENSANDANSTNADNACNACNACNAAE